jgi:hypothetical protein
MSFRFRPQPSRRLSALVYVLHLAAVLALNASALPWTGLAPMAMLLAMHATFTLRRVNLRDGRSIVVVDFDEADLLIELCNGRRIPVNVTDIYCTAWLQVARFSRKTKQAGVPFWLVVLPDGADADSRRQLRACLLTLPLGAPAG